MANIETAIIDGVWISDYGTGDIILIQGHTLPVTMRPKITSCDIGGEELYEDYGEDTVYMLKKLGYAELDDKGSSFVINHSKANGYLFHDQLDDKIKNIIVKYKLSKFLND